MSDLMSAADAPPGPRVAERSAPTGRDTTRRWGYALIGGALVTTLFNVLFPRATEPFDHAVVLAMMAENHALRQFSFLALTASLAVIAAGLAGVSDALTEGGGEGWARFSRYGLLVGVTLFTVASALGLAATTASLEWAAAGASVSGHEFAVAAALNAADDSVWFAFIVVFWASLAMLGVGMLRGRRYPQWMGGSIAALGLANAIVVGLPLLYGMQAPALLIAFGVIGQLSLLWVLVTGIALVRGGSHA